MGRFGPQRQHWQSVPYVGFIILARYEQPNGHLVLRHKHERVGR